MKHSSTRELFEYWNERRGSRAAPERGDIDPGPIRHVLADTFILSFNPAVGHPFRLAGTRLCALFGRELKGEPFLDLWTESAGQSLREIVTTVGSDSAGVVGGATGRTASGSTIKLELVLLPLAHRGRMPARLLGVMAPFEVPYWFGDQPVANLSLGTVRHLGAALDIDDAADFPGVGSRRRNGLLVYEGGRSPES